MDFIIYEPLTGRLLVKIFVSDPDTQLHDTNIINITDNPLKDDILQNMIKYKVILINGIPTIVPI